MKISCASTEGYIGQKCMGLVVALFLEMWLMVNLVAQASEVCRQPLLVVVTSVEWPHSPLWANECVCKTREE